MISLRANNLRWINGPADDPTDLCAHADIEFAINDVLLDATTGANLKASAAALFLLRTLERSHTAADPVAEHLFPCCGFTMWEQDDSPDVAVCGCPNGANFDVRHTTEGVSIRTTDGREWSVSAHVWRAAVFAFADQVAAFYEACAPKRPSADDAPGWRAFRAEWERRRGSPLSARPESP